MSKHRKNWSLEEKRKIVSEGQSSGVVKTTRKHSISTQTYYNWKRLLEASKQPSEGLNTSSEAELLLSKKERTELVRLRKENKSLKTLLGEKELALLIKDELLKKKGL